MSLETLIIIIAIYLVVLSAATMVLYMKILKQVCNFEEAEEGIYRELGKIEYRVDLLQAGYENLSGRVNNIGV